MTDEIFTEEIIKKIEKRVYWATISILIGFCFIWVSMTYYGTVNLIALFVFIIGVSFLNPDDRIKGVSTK
jgi:hypothetical protein